MSDMTWDAKKANPENKDSVKWKCHPQLCKYESINIEICQQLFSDIADMSEEESSTYSLVIGYLDDLDICKSSFTLLQKHGHSYYCHPKNGCDSAFRALRALAPHFLVLRNFVRALYKAVYKCKIIRDITVARTAGNFQMLHSLVEEAICKIQIKCRSVNPHI